MEKSYCTYKLYTIGYNWLWSWHEEELSIQAIECVLEPKSLVHIGLGICLSGMKNLCLGMFSWTSKIGKVLSTHYSISVKLKILYVSQYWVLRTWMERL